MELRQLGRSGLRVSRLGLGTMTWSRDTDAHEAGEQLKDFVDAGGTLLDTAASYANGASEELIGQLLETAVPRDEVVLCTKAGVRRTATGGVVDASRGALLSSLDSSLARLRTDTVDLWLVQTPDPRTPLEETVSALRLAVTSGRARYVGLSNHPGWQTARAATLLGDEIGLTAVEVEYSLLQRGVEREVLPAATSLGIGVLAWSPLGRGVL
ncbi:MAG: aldo/keto reductase, partial [Cellulomonas sp.]